MTALLYDTFTDTNGTSLASHTMDVGAGWTIHSGTWTVQSNHAESAKTDGILCTAAGGASNGTLTCDVMPTDNASNAFLAGLVFRYTDTSNFWLVHLDSRLDVVTVFRNLAGSFTSQGTSTPTMTSGVAYAVSVVLNGTSIGVTINGGNAINVTSSSHQSATRYGMRCGLTSGPATVGQWDNFLLDDGVAAGSGARYIGAGPVRQISGG
jgi:hypothetical protein